MTDARVFRGFRFPAVVVRRYLRFPVSDRDLKRRVADHDVAIGSTILDR